MNVSIDELRKITEILLNHVEQTGVQTVELAHDYYWHVPQESRYEPYTEPGELSMGQLSDDWAELQRISRGEKDPLGYGLVWLASVLRAVGEETAG